MKIGVICTNIYQKAKDYKNFLLQKDASFFDVEKLSVEEIKKQIDIFLVLGGDGFMLKTLHKYYKYNKPFCGINFGNLGFLLNKLNYFEGKNISEEINNCQICKINPINVEFTNKKGEKFTNIAINEIVIFRETYKITDLDIYINGIKKIQNYGGDGLILSTPIGSCAYNYSSGGVILPLNSQNLILTPISPIRKNNFRSILLDNNFVFEFKNNNEASRGTSLHYDCFEFFGVSTVKSYLNKNIDISILFHNNKTIEEKITEEQFK